MLVTLFPISTLVKPLQYEKRFLPDARNAVRDRDARQAAATPKRTLPDPCNAVRDRDARQAAAIVKCIISNSGNARSNYNLFNCIIILPRRTTRFLIIVHFPFSGYCKHPVIVKCPREESSTLSRRYCP